MRAVVQDAVRAAALAEILVEAERPAVPRRTALLEAYPQELLPERRVLPAVAVADAARPMTAA